MAIKHRPQDTASWGLFNDIRWYSTFLCSRKCGFTFNFMWEMSLSTWRSFNTSLIPRKHRKPHLERWETEWPLSHSQHTAEQRQAKSSIEINLQRLQCEDDTSSNCRRLDYGSDTDPEGRSRHPNVDQTVGPGPRCPIVLISNSNSTSTCQCVNQSK